MYVLFKNVGFGFGNWYKSIYTTPIIAKPKAISFLLKKIRTQTQRRIASLEFYYEYVLFRIYDVN